MTSPAKSPAKANSSNPLADSNRAAGSGEKLPPKTKGIWATGAIADVFMANSINTLVMPIYNIALKVDPVFLGFAQAIPRLWEAISDALVGNLSDNTRSRWGRRRPYIALGAILSGLSFALVWMPPAEASPTDIGIFFLISSILYFTAFAIFTVPWMAMGLELSDDYHERTNVQAWKVIVQQSGAMSLGLLWWFSLRVGANEVEGVRLVGLVVGCVIALAGVVPAIFLRERPAAFSREKKISIFKATTVTFENPPFLLLAGFTICLIFGVFVINPLVVYINLLHVYGGDKLQVSTLNMVAGVAYNFAGLALTPVIVAISARVGKKMTLTGGAVMVMCGFLTSWWTYTPAAPYLQIVTLILISPGLACLWVIGPSMLADVCDLDEAKTGLRRQGIYSACYTWTIKVGIALSVVLSGYMLTWSGYDANREAAQAEGVVERLRLLYMWVPVGTSLLALVFIWFYPLSEQRVAEIRRRISESPATEE